MKLTARCEYALLALVYLSRIEFGETVTVEAIATAQEIPQKFLEQILLNLKRNKIVSSTKGQRGGYRLSRPASEVTLAEVIRLIDGALAPTGSASHFFYRTTPVEREKKLHRVFRQIRDSIADRLEHTTLAQMA
jgi:Rrf2 family cysteine metabolism transcriptional repressor